MPIPKAKINKSIGMIKIGKPSIPDMPKKAKSESCQLKQQKATIDSITISVPMTIWRIGLCRGDLCVGTVFCMR